MASLPLILSALILVLLTASAVAQNNVLLTGQILRPNGQLSNGRATLVMQSDCNLVLSNGGRGFQSGTSGRGENCNLSLNSNGQLIIRRPDGLLVWQTGRSQNGQYAAVLRLDGQFVIYGPQVWSTSSGGVEDGEITMVTVE